MDSDTWNEGNAMPGFSSAALPNNSFGDPLGLVHSDKAPNGFSYIETCAAIVDNRGGKYVFFRYPVGPWSVSCGETQPLCWASRIYVAVDGRADRLRRRPKRPKSNFNSPRRRFIVGCQLLCGRALQRVSVDARTWVQSAQLYFEFHDYIH